MKWLPIETAPRDGTRILGACKYFVDICYTEHKHGEDRWMTALCESFGGWEEPTHWMPLPDKPE